MAEILLVTLNAKYIHSSFGLRSLRANLGTLREKSALREYIVGQRPLEIAELILAEGPSILGLGVYIWNVLPCLELVTLLKTIRPALTIVLGGPEVSYETEGQELVAKADYVIAGEGEHAFRELCGELLAGRRPPEKIIRPEPPNTETLALPYDEYLEEDIRNRLVYVEASRGCPFTCEFCLSSLDIPVRAFPLEPFLAAMDKLLSRGVLHFKFVDRTFNLNPETSRRILEFFLERLRPGLFLHFEMVPDRVTEGLRELLARFPAGSLQLELGVQTFNPEAATAIRRRQDYDKLEGNLRYLHEHTHAHVHADLIVGLPGEDEASFARGFDRLLSNAPQEIQVGILKRLRGTTLSRHNQEWNTVYSPTPPYEILSNKLIDFTAMQGLRRFARMWDLIGNSGNFVESTPLIWRGRPSPYAAFKQFTSWYHEREGRHHAIALVRSMERVLEFLIQERGVAPREAAAALWRDYQRGERGEMPPFLRQLLPDEPPHPAHRTLQGQRRTVKRQERHQVAAEPQPQKRGSANAERDGEHDAIGGM
jgi:hypothetical protein